MSRRPGEPKGRESESMRCFKLSGAGNDFIALTGPASPAPEKIRAWCRRGLSLGADGLFVLDRLGPGAVRMSYYNSDGGPADLCVNGTRCAARLAYELGWAADDDVVTVETGAGPARARRLGPTEVVVEVPLPSGDPEALAVEVGGTAYRGHLVTVGVPHFVLDWPQATSGSSPDGEAAGLADAPVASVGPALRHHPAFGAAGANVDFVHAVDERRIEIRSYERGVEGETLACGSGVLAAAAVAIAAGDAALPLEALTRGGFVLTVDGQVEPVEGRRLRRWSLEGDARIVARGELTDEAADLPRPPDWR